jgi:hypothetical protein
MRKVFHIPVLKYYDMSLMQCHPHVALRSLKFKASNVHVTGHSFYFLFMLKKGIDSYLCMQK